MYGCKILSFGLKWILDNSTNEQYEVNKFQVRLDADQFKERFFIYRFNVTAQDNGFPSLQSTATVHIRTENTNDEAPVFLPTDQYTAYVAEDAQGGTPVVQIQVDFYTSFSVFAKFWKLHYFFHLWFPNFTAVLCFSSLEKRSLRK